MQTVTKKDTALAYHSGGLEVLATPAMIALMEAAAYNQLKEGGEESVGTELNIKHTRACGIGAQVYATAAIVAREGNKVMFSVKAFDEKGEIGSGAHTRYIIDPDRFMNKLNGR